MAATAVAASCKPAILFPLSAPKPPPHNSSPLTKLHYSNRRTSYSNIFSPPPHISKLTPPSVSSPETTAVVVEEEEEQQQSGAPQDDDDDDEDDDTPLDSASLPPLTGCKACGQEEIERGCNGEGRIQGGIATVPGFGWWPIKAYRPCPAYVASGGRYRRTGQSMDEVVSGGGGNKAASDSGAKSRKKEEGSKSSKSLKR